MNPPNEMDHFFDTRSAWKRFERNFNKWMNADFDAEIGQPKRHTVKLVAEQHLAARGAMRALIDLARQAHFTLEYFVEHGYGRVKPRHMTPTLSKVFKAADLESYLAHLETVAKAELAEAKTRAAEAKKALKETRRKK